MITAPPGLAPPIAARVDSTGLTVIIVHCWAESPKAARRVSIVPRFAHHRHLVPMIASREVERRVRNLP